MDANKNKKNPMKEVRDRLTQEQKAELIDETTNKIKHSGLLFFSNTAIIDNNDLTNRCKNASIFVIIITIFSEKINKNLLINSLLKHK